MKTSMRREKVDYIISCGERKGTAAGFRDWIKRRCDEEPGLFDADKLRDDAATKEWQRPDPDEDNLFSVADVQIPRILTCYAPGFHDPDEFAKVFSEFAVLQDLYDNAIIKMRQATASSAAADRLMKNYDKVSKAAGGNMRARLKDIK